MMEVLHAIVHLLVLPFVLIVRMGVACRLGRGLLLFLLPGLLTLEAAASQDRELQLSWLRYWVVVSLFLLVEPLLDLLPLPFLTIAKLIGLAWCLAAEPISGSRILFDQVSPSVFTIYPTGFGLSDPPHMGRGPNQVGFVGEGGKRN